MMKFSKSSLDRLSTCHEDLQTLANEAIKNPPYDFGISWGYRTPEQQFKLYQKGRTLPGKIVTSCDGYIKKSKHNYDPSLAFDIKCYMNGKITWSHQIFLEMGLYIMEIAEKLFDENKIKNKIIWGGYWHGKSKDMPHYQI